MQTHIPTMFLMIVAANATLAVSVGVMSDRSARDGLKFWAAALLLYTAAFTLFGLPGQAGQPASIIFGNTLLVAAAALFTQGVLQFQRRCPPRWLHWLLWLPVPLIGLLSASLLDQPGIRIVLGSLIFVVQNLVTLVLLLQQRQQTVGKGQYGLVLGLALAVVVPGLRVLQVASGHTVPLTLIGPDQEQTLTYLISLVSTSLITLGFLAMSKERSEQALTEGHQFAQGVLDAVLNHIAVLDHEGVIVATNAAWRRFARDNSGQSGELAANTDVGTNYLDVCKAGESTSEEARQTRDGILAVLQGRKLTYSIEYPCHSPTEQRWFTLTVSPLGDGRRGAVVVHTNITARKQAEQTIHQLAYYDVLTALPNRRLLRDRLTQALAQIKRSGSCGALMFLDLDNFKPINDSYGHAVGDLLLVEVAQRLSRCVREVDTVARFGGDEFVIMLGGLALEPASAKAQTLAVAEKAQTLLAEPYLLQAANAAGGSVRHVCSASIGVVLLDSASVSPAAVLEHGDAAMYQAKQDGRNRIRFYQPPT